MIQRFEKSATNAYGFIVVLPDGYKEQNKYPLLIHLHGVGGRGNGSSTDLDKLVTGELPLELQRAAEKYGFIIIAPQTSGDWTNAETDHVLNWASKNLSIDWTKAYLFGTSLGGGGVTRYVSASVANASKFAAAVSVCGLNWISKAKNIADAKLPMIFFHSQDDNTVSVSNTNNAVSAINANPMPVPAKKVIYPSGQHWIWGRVYDPDNRPWIDNEKPATLYDWLLMNEQGKPVAVPVFETKLIAKAVAKLTGNVVELNGRQSVGYKENMAGWSVTAVPSGVDRYKVITEGGGWIDGKAVLTKQGTYTFRLTLRDVNGATAFDEVVVNYGSVSEPIPDPPAEEKPEKRIVAEFRLVYYDDGSYDFWKK